jgi:DNA polymerase-3 subunit epsilon
MQDYVLFIDTETSGLPPKLNTPIEQIEKWPFVVQISWAVYAWDGQLVKKENYFIFDKSIIIEKTAEQIHGITMNALSFRGLRRKVVMLALIKDIKKYNPLIVGHYIDFDLKMVEVALFRSGLKHSLRKSRKYCTMLATTEYTRLPNSTYPKLEDLYLCLFGERMEQVHNAEFDVLATSKCFFKLLEKGEIDQNAIKLQSKLRDKTKSNEQESGCGLQVLVLTLLLAIIYWL